MLKKTLIFFILKAKTSVLHEEKMYVRGNFSAEYTQITMRREIQHALVRKLSEYLVKNYLFLHSYIKFLTTMLTLEYVSYKESPGSS